MNAPFPFALPALLQEREVEDIVLKPTGLAYFARGRWHGPQVGADTQNLSLQRLAQHVAESASLTLGLTQPCADGYLNAPDGSAFRAHVVMEPLVEAGPEITLRRLPRPRQLQLNDFALSPSDAKRLTQSVLAGHSLLIAGATGAGKTSLLSSLLELLPPHTRVLVLEDNPELPLPTPLSSKLLTRQNRFGFREGAQWDLAALVYESLRMRPDRLVLGECRGSEAHAIAQALQTGHRGLFTSIHAGSCAEAIQRFAGLAKQTVHWDVVLHLKQEAGRRHVSDILWAHDDSD